MRTKEEILAELKQVEESEQPSSQEQVSVKVEQDELELALKINLRNLKDKEKQVDTGGKFKRHEIVELDQSRRDNLKTPNTMRNEIDELKFIIERIKRNLPKVKVEELEKLIEEEK